MQSLKPPVDLYTLRPRYVSNLQESGRTWLFYTPAIAGVERAVRPDGGSTVILTRFGRENGLPFR